MQFQSKILLFLTVAIVFMNACSDDDSPDDINIDFDRSAMLQNMGNNIILPAYENMQAENDELNAAINSFLNSPDVPTLQAAQERLKEARLAWQHVNLYQFGPAVTVAIRSFINTYPTDTAKIENNISSGSFTLGTLDNQDAAGYPAMGYLLHGIADTPEGIVARYTTADDAPQRSDYLQQNMSFIKSQIDEVANGWQADGGNYIGTFLSDENAGIDVGSSLGQLFNASFVVHYERFLRDAKIGIPAGVVADSVMPRAVEAFYGGYSAELAVENMEAVENLYLGRTLQGTDGIGLEENLLALGAEELDNNIKTGISEAKTALNNLSDPLSGQIKDNNDPVVNTFVEILDLVELFKADMASRLGITITFQDNDGD